MRRREQRFAHSEHAVEWRADFVAHIGQELTFGAGARLGRHLGGGEFRFGVHARALHTVRGKATDEREQHTDGDADGHDAVEAPNPIVVTIDTKRDPNKSRNAAVLGENRRIGAHPPGPIRGAGHWLYDNRTILPHLEQLRWRDIHATEFDVLLYAVGGELAARRGVQNESNGVAHHHARDDAFDGRVAVEQML